MQVATDDALVLRRSVERPEEFAQIYRRHVPVILRYVAARLGPDTAEDATHEVFIRAFRQRSRYEAQFETALPWIYGIAANVIADHRRQEARRLHALEVQLRTASTTSTTDGGPLPGGLDPALVSALTALPLVDREAFLLAVWGELSYDEIAVAMAVPVGTVRSRVSRARTRLAASPSLRPPSPTVPSTPGEAHA